MTYKIVTFQKI